MEKETQEKDVKSEEQETATVQSEETSAEDELRNAVEGAEKEEKVEEPSTQDVKDEQDTQKKDSKYVPRDRLNQELDRNKQMKGEMDTLRQQIEALQSQIQSVRQPDSRKDPEIEREIKELADEYFEGNEERARKFYEKQNKIAERQADSRVGKLESKVSGLLTTLAVKEIATKDPFAQKYEADIIKKLEDVPPHIRTDKRVIRDAILIVKGERYDADMKEAEQRGSKRNEEQKKIVSSGLAEAPSAAKRESKTALTPAEKAMAARLGMSETEYAAGKK